MALVEARDLLVTSPGKKYENLSWLFHTSAAAYPDNTAVIFCHEDHCARRVTYKELQFQVRRVCAELSRWCRNSTLQTAPVSTPYSSHEDQSIVGTTAAQGDSTQGCISSNAGIAIIGILCLPGIEAVASLLACLENYAYLYISSDYTNREIKLLCEKICPEKILVQEEYLAKITDIYTVNIFASFQIFDCCFKLVSVNIERESNFQKYLLMRDLAYVVPTSGSTGSPKCVYVPHSSIVPNIRDLVSVFNLRSDDRILAAAPLTFDPSVVDMFMAFQVGAALVVPSRILLRMPSYLVSTMVQVGVTVLQATPSLLFSLGRDRLQQSMFSGAFYLKILALGGELFPKLSVLTELIGQAHQTRIFNLYGITEVSCWATMQEVAVGKPLSRTDGKLDPLGYSLADIIDMTPIGSPLTSTQVRLLDDRGNNVGEGEAGEIFVGGIERQCWVDDGSWSMTKVRAHLRSTGDKGALNDGNIYYLGRIANSQIKRKGQKISLEEIAAVCRSLEYVALCHVTLNAEGKVIVFVLPVERQNSVKKDVLWNDLKKFLNPGKQPDDVVIVTKMPFNSHAKIDIHHLLSLYYHSAKLIQRKSKHETLESFFRELWLRIIGCNDYVSPDDNFIKSGGNSLNAVQFIEELEHFVGFKIITVLDVLLNDSYQKAFQLVRKLQYSQGKLEKVDNFNSRTKKIRLLEAKDLKCSLVSLKTKNNLDSDILLRYSESDKSYKDVRLLCERQYSEVIMVASRRGEYSTRTTPQIMDRPETHERPPLWRYKLNKCIDSSPVIVEYCDGTILVMVGSHSHRFCCVNGATGASHWNLTLGDRVESSPAISIDGMKVYVGCYDGKLYCIHVSDGALAWEYETEGRGEIKSSPVVDEQTGCVVFGAHDKKLYCLSSDGTLNWALQISEGSVFSSPCILRSMVFVATLDGILASVNKETGKVHWESNIGSPIFSSPALYSDGVVVGSVGGQILGYSLSGQKLWEFKTNSTVFSSAFVLQLRDGREVIGIGSHDHHTYFLNGDGELLTQFVGSSPIYATPFLCLAENPNAFRAVICETSGKVCVISVSLARVFSDKEHMESKAANHKSSKEPETQLQSTKSSFELEWERKLEGEIFASPVCHQGRVYVGCRDDYLYCFDLSSVQT